MSKKIKHNGVVIDVNNNLVRVQIVQMSACAHCSAAKHCNASESKEKIIEIETADAKLYSEGENVVVLAEQKVGFLAVLFGAVLPLMVLMLSITIAMLLLNDELIASLIAFVVLGIYFCTLYLCRKKLKNMLSFSLEKY